MKNREREEDEMDDGGGGAGSTSGGSTGAGSGSAVAVVPLRYGGGTVSTTHEAANPATGILWEIRRTAYNILALEQLLAGLTGNELVWGPITSESRTSLIGLNDYEKERSGSGISDYVKLYIAEREHYSKITKAAVDADLDARMVMASAETSEHYYRAIQTALDYAELTEEERQRFMTRVSTALQTQVDGLGLRQMRERRELERHRLVDREAGRSY